MTSDLSADLNGVVPTSSGLTTSLLNGETVSERRVRFASRDMRIFNSRKEYRLNVDQQNMGSEKTSLYFRDVFHTLVNMPTYRFLILFVASYVSMYMVYALVYMQQPTECISRVHKFSHALWFSVHTSATIGYGHMAPDPDCVILNLAIMAQVLTTCLMQATVLGLVYARFSAPSRRAATIKFSNILAMYKESDDGDGNGNGGGGGLYKLAFRVANMRRHQVLHPNVRMLMLYNEQVERNVFEHRYKELPLKHIGGGLLWLGLPSIMAHKVDVGSPLWGKNREEIEAIDAEFIVLLDGVDETTSAAMQARHSYFASDIQWDVRFAGLLQRREAGGFRADYSHFDLTRLVADEAAGV